MSFGGLWKKLFTGKYEFYADGNQYAEESFEVQQHAQHKTLWFRSYVFTRSNTGELFKVFVDYELFDTFMTRVVRIKKTAGSWTTEEEYYFDPKENLLKYSFKNPEGVHKDERAVLKKFFIQTPSALCSALFAASKKGDNSGRSPYVLMKSPNLINYEGPMEEYTVFVSFETKDAQTFNINNSQYQYTRCDIYSTDAGELENEFPVVIQVSKKFALPFLVQFDQHHQARLVQLDTAANIDANAL